MALIIKYKMGNKKRRSEKQLANREKEEVNQEEISEEDEHTSVEPETAL